MIREVVAPRFIDREFFSKLAKLAIPVTIQTLLHSSRNMVDILMIGQIGEAELAAVGLAGSVFFVAFSLLFGLNSGVGILGAQHWGAKNPGGVRKTVALGTLVGLAAAVPVTLLLVLKPEWLAMLVTDRAEVIPLSSRYLTVAGATMFTAALVVPFETGLNSIGRPKFNLVFTGIGVATNIFLNWVLIFGNLGAPALGLEGAAWATLVSGVVEVVAVYGYFYGTGHFLAPRLTTLVAALDGTQLRRFLKLSLPLALNGVIWALGMFIYHVAYGHMGTAELAVMSMMEPIAMLCFAFFWGISSATGIMLGHHLGADEFEHAWVRAWVLTALGFVASLLAAASVWLARDLIFGLYSGVNPDTMALAHDVLVVLLLTIWLKAVNVVAIVGVLQSGGDNRFILKMDMFCQWCVGIPLTFLAAFHWQLPLTWVFAAVMSEEGIKLFICLPRVYNRGWARNLVADDEGPILARDSAETYSSGTITAGTPDSTKRRE